MILECSIPAHFVSEMTYTVSSGTLNSTIPYHTLPTNDAETRNVIQW